MNTDNDYILISGASSGIGRGIAKRLSECSNVIIHGNNHTRLLETYEFCSKKNKILIWQHDLNDLYSLSEKLERFVIENKIGIKKFIHSAGVSHISSLKSMKLNTIDKILKINFYSAAEITRTLIQRKINRKNLNNIVFISSLAGLMGEKGNSIYSLTKGALDGLMRSLAAELSPNIRVNSVLPGLVKTNMSDSFLKTQSDIDSISGNYPLGIGNIEDIVNMVDFLISDKSEWITGQSYIVDGGRSLI